MKVKLKTAWSNFQVGAILQVDDNYSIPVRNIDGTYSYIPASFLEDSDGGVQGKSGNGSLISVTQEMKSLNIEFK